MQPLPFPRVLECLEPVIQTARPVDIPRLVEFTKSFATLPGSQSNRFPTDHSSWQTLIKGQDVVCAIAADGRIAGYYVVNQLAVIYGPEELHELRSAHNVLCNRLRISHQNVSFGAQALIKTSTDSSDLRVHLLRALLRTVGLRYRYLFTELKKNNSQEMLALPREGWRCFHEEDDVCYMMLDVPKVLRQLASHLMLRLPHLSESSLPQETHAQPLYLRN